MPSIGLGMEEDNVEQSDSDEFAEVSGKSGRKNTKKGGNED